MSTLDKLLEGLTTEGALKKLLNQESVTKEETEEQTSRFVDLIIDLIAERSEEKAEEVVDKHERDYDHDSWT